jgi:hypothetical protein
MGLSNLVGTPGGFHATGQYTFFGTVLATYDVTASPDPNGGEDLQIVNQAGSSGFFRTVWSTVVTSGLNFGPINCP